MAMDEHGRATALERYGKYKKPSTEHGDLRIRSLPGLWIKCADEQTKRRLERIKIERGERQDG